MTIDEIEKNIDIPERDKYRMIKLLNFGVKYIKTRDDKWQEYYDIFVQYINSSEKIRNEFSKNCTIKNSTEVEQDGVIIKIGSWFKRQKEILKESH